MVPTIDLSLPRAELIFMSPRGKTLSEAVYLFDQEAGRNRVPYCVENISGNQVFGFRFHIFVEESKYRRAQEIIAKLYPPNAVPRASTGREFWTDLITAESKDFHGWHIAILKEFAFQRIDGQDYVAFLFRNSARTQFGIEEFFGGTHSNDTWPPAKWRKLAVKVNVETDARNPLLSDDPDLPKMWRHH